MRELVGLTGVSSLFPPRGSQGFGAIWKSFQLKSKAMKWMWLFPCNLPPPLVCGILEEAGERCAYPWYSAALGTPHALLLSMLCHSRRSCSSSGSCSPLGCSRAKEIPPHIKHSWGDLLTWILLSESRLQLPLLPKYARPKWLLPQTGIRAFHCQSWSPGEMPVAGRWDSWSSSGPPLCRGICLNWALAL